MQPLSRSLVRAPRRQLLSGALSCSLRSQPLPFTPVRGFAQEPPVIEDPVASIKQLRAKKWVKMYPPGPWMDYMKNSGDGHIELWTEDDPPPRSDPGSGSEAFLSDYMSGGAAGAEVSMTMRALKDRDTFIPYMPERRLRDEWHRPEVSNAVETMSRSKVNIEDVTAEMRMDQMLSHTRKMQIDPVLTNPHDYWRSFMTSYGLTKPEVFLASLNKEELNFLKENKLPIEEIPEFEATTETPWSEMDYTRYHGARKSIEWPTDLERAQQQEEKIRTVDRAIQRVEEDRDAMRVRLRAEKAQTALVQKRVKPPRVDPLESLDTKATRIAQDVEEEVRNEFDIKSVFQGKGAKRRRYLVRKQMEEEGVRKAFGQPPKFTVAPDHVPTPVNFDVEPDPKEDQLAYLTAAERARVMPVKPHDLPRFQDVIPFMAYSDPEIEEEHSEYPRESFWTDERKRPSARYDYFDREELAIGVHANPNAWVPRERIVHPVTKQLWHYHRVRRLKALIREQKQARDVMELMTSKPFPHFDVKTTMRVPEDAWKEPVYQLVAREAQLNGSYSNKDKLKLMTFFKKVLTRINSAPTEEEAVATE